MGSNPAECAIFRSPSREPQRSPPLSGLCCFWWSLPDIPMRDVCSPLPEEALAKWNSPDHWPDLSDHYHRRQRDPGLSSAELNPLKPAGRMPIPW